MKRPRILDLFCGAGGAGEGYRRAGFDVVGVDIAPMPRHPAHSLFARGVEFYRADALSFLRSTDLAAFDVIHASPPCQGYLNLGGVNRAQGRAYEHPQTIADVRLELRRAGLPYVIENVEDARGDMDAPVRICGTGLGRPLRRHRMFESNVPLTGVPCDHARFSEPRYWTGWTKARALSTVVQVYGNGGGRHEWGPAMGIDWMTPDEMAEAIPPAYTEHIGRQLIAHLGAVAS